jgi:hypothetical protein
VTGRICLTADEAFQAGFDAPCEHQVPDPAACPDCRLTTAEIRRLAVLLRSEPPAKIAPHAAAA